MTAPGMARIAGWSIAHRWLVVARWVLLAVLIAPVFSLNLGEPQAAATAATAPAAARAGLGVLTSSGIGPGVLRPPRSCSPCTAPHRRPERLSPS